MTAADTDGPAFAPGTGGADRPALGWPEIVVAAVVYVGLQALLTTVALVVGDGRTPASPWLVAISGAAAFGAVAAAAVLRVRSLEALGLRRVPVRTVALAVAGGLAVWVVSRGLIIAYVLVTGDHSDPQAELADFGGPVATVLVVTLGGLLVPLGEELLFRGVCFGALRRYGTVVAAVLSAAVFALAHGLNVVFAAAFLLGLVNAVVYGRTRSIWPCAATHATFNLLSFGLALLVR